ncbi:MAG: hypothetical protein R3F56_26365 [Planctomycetota bacterium]
MQRGQQNLGSAACVLGYGGFAAFRFRFIAREHGPCPLGEAARSLDPQDCARRLGPQRHTLVAAEHAWVGPIEHRFEQRQRLRFAAVAEDLDGELDPEHRRLPSHREQRRQVGVRVEAKALAQAPRLEFGARVVLGEDRPAERDTQPPRAVGRQLGERRRELVRGAEGQPRSECQQVWHRAAAGGTERPEQAQQLALVTGVPCRGCRRERVHERPSGSVAE